MIKYIKEPDWASSKTLPSVMWKNPLYTPAELLEMADGAVVFEREVNANLRNQIKELKRELNLTDSDIEIMYTTEKKSFSSFRDGVKATVAYFNKEIYDKLL